MPKQNGQTMKTAKKFGWKKEAESLTNLSILMIQMISLIWTKKTAAIGVVGKIRAVKMRKHTTKNWT